VTMRNFDSRWTQSRMTNLEAAKRKTSADYTRSWALTISPPMDQVVRVVYHDDIIFFQHRHEDVF